MVFTGKNHVFTCENEKKPVKVGNKAINQSFGENLKKTFFAANVFFFQLFCIKTGAQHPNAGGNIQKSSSKAAHKISKKKLQDKNTFYLRNPIR